MSNFYSSRPLPGLGILMQFSVYWLLIIGFAPAAQAVNFCSSLSCFSSSDDTPPVAKPKSSSITCTNPKAPKKSKGWSVYKATGMPTVEDIVADLRLCGIVTASDVQTVFYSFNGGLTNAEKFQDANPSLNLKQINQVLPQSWYDALKKFPALGRAQSPAQMAWVARSSQALAKVSKNKVYMVADPSANIYTVPYTPPRPDAWKGQHNVWYDYEFATLQANTDVTGIYTVNSNTLAVDDSATGSWVRGRDAANAPGIDANSVTGASIQAQIDAYCSSSANQRRGTNSSVSACELSATSNNSTITAAPTATSTMSCELHEQDPDQGVDQAYCLCDSSVTLTPLSIASTAEQSASCAYTTMPGSTAQETVTTQTEIWTSNCVACTIVGGIADSETCTSVSGCTPTAAPSPTIVAWVSNSTLQIGDAEDDNNGTSLAQEMYGKLRDFCSGSSCTTDMADMSNVEYILDKGEEPLTPQMYIQDASYSSTADLEQMLAVGLAAWIGAMRDTNLGLCSNVEYEAYADETASGCGTGPIPSKIRRAVRRRDNKVLFQRNDYEMEKRCEEKRDTQEGKRCGGGGEGMLCHYNGRVCDAPNEITVIKASTTNPYAGHMNIGVQIKTDSGGFSCEDAAALIEALTLALAPELLEADALEGIELASICGVVDDAQAAMSSVTAVLPGKRTAMPIALATSTAAP